MNEEHEKKLFQDGKEHFFNFGYEVKWSFFRFVSFLASFVFLSFNTANTKQTLSEANQGSLASEATALPTMPQPLPQVLKVVLTICCLHFECLNV